MNKIENLNEKQLSRLIELARCGLNHNYPDENNYTEQYKEFDNIINSLKQHQIVNLNVSKQRDIIYHEMLEWLNGEYDDAYEIIDKYIMPSIKKESDAIKFAQWIASDYCEYKFIEAFGQGKWVIDYKIDWQEKSLENHLEGLIDTVGITTEELYQIFKTSTMRGKFKLIGLVKPNTMTCEPLDSENIFWVESGVSKIIFESLFKYCKDNWKEKKKVVLEHEGLYKDGTPINPKFIHVIDDN